MGNYRNRPLSGYLPGVIKEIREYKAITGAEQPEIFALFEAIQRALDNQFVETSTEYGVKRWEKMLKITPKATASLDERKFVILARLGEQLPFTYRRLERMLELLCGESGYEMILRSALYELEVIVKLEAISNYEAVRSMLKRVVPANLVIMNVLELPEMESGVYIAAGSRINVMETTLPELVPGDFSASVNIISGAANVSETRLALLPDVPREAFTLDKATGAMIDVYIKDSINGIDPAYVKPPEENNQRG